MKKTVFHLVLLIFLFFMTPGLFSDQTGEDNELIRVGIFPFEPMNFIDESGEAAGLYPDLLREMTKGESWSVSFVEGSWSEGLERLQNEEIDLMISVAYTEERDKIMDFNTVSVIELWSQIFTRPSEQSININDLDGKRVAIMAKDINGQHYIDTASGLGIVSEIVEYPTHDAVFAAVRDGEVLAGVAPQHFGLRHVEMYDLIPSSILFSPFSIYFATKEGIHSDLLRHLDYHLIEWKEEKNSFYYRTLTYWMTGKDLRRIVVPTWLIVSLVLFFSLALLFLLFVFILRVQVRKRTDDLFRQERQYRTLVEYARDIIIRLSEEGSVIAVNHFALEYFGLTPETIIGRNPEGIIFSSECSLKEKLKKEKDRFTDRVTGPDGKERFIQWSFNFIKDDAVSLSEMLCIGVDITDRLSVEKNLKETNEQLEEMVYIASHDLQVPLVSMNGYAGELLENYNHLLDEEGQFCLKRLQSNAMRMHKLVLSLLDISRLNTLEMNRSRFSLSDIIEKIELDMAIILQDKDISLKYADLPVLQADQSRIEGVFRNLILNAVLYDGKHIVISAEGNSVYIKDDGMGIPPSQLEKIFKPGERLKMNDSEGVGMGLTFCRKVVERHGGTLTASSGGEGEGSLFRIVFPEAIFAGEENEQR